MLQAARDGFLVASGGFSGKGRTVAYAILHKVLRRSLNLHLYYGVLRAHEVLRQPHCLHHTMLRAFLIDPSFLGLSSEFRTGTSKFLRHSQTTGVD